MRGTLWRFWVAGLAASALMSCVPLTAQESPQEDPFVRLLDSGAKPSLSLTRWPAKLDPAWHLVPEGTMEHSFRGDVVVQNDKLRLLLQKKGEGVEVWARQGSDFRRRAILRPLPAAGNGSVELQSLGIVENTGGSVMLQCAYVTADKSARASFQMRLAAGDLTGEFRPGEGTRGMTLESMPEYVICPDLLGADVVFSPRNIRTDRVLLPSESLCLHMLSQGEAMVLCLWKRGGYRAEACVVKQGGETVFGPTVLTSDSKATLWVAVFEGQDFWKQTLPDDTARLRWQPPFPAKWRADVTTGRWPPVSFDYQNGISIKDRVGGETAAMNAPLILYPLDRSRETPMSIFSPVDVMRNVLGVGPCQFILDAEGGASAQESLTPQQVAQWLEKQLKRKKLNKQEMEERFSQMLSQLEQNYQRIERYGKTSAKLGEFCAQARPSSKDGVALKEFTLIATRQMENDIADGRLSSSPRSVSEMSRAIVEQMGTDDMSARLTPLIAKLMEAGVAHEKLLARSRMTMLWLHQQAVMLAELKNADADLAQTVAMETAAFFGVKK